MSSRLSLVILLAALIAGSLLPERAKHLIGTQGYWHRPLHVALFAATSAAACAAFPRRTASVAILLLALAASLELAEHFVYRNRFEWPDVRDDSLGILAGIALFSARKQL